METLWTLSIQLARTNGLEDNFAAIKDNTSNGVVRFVNGELSDFSVATTLPELNTFLQAIGYGKGSPDPTPNTVEDYTFRFAAVTTNGSINVLGSNKELSSIDEQITADLAAVLADLNADSEFVSFMNSISA